MFRLIRGIEPAGEVVATNPSVRSLAPGAGTTVTATLPPQPDGEYRVVGETLIELE